MADPAPGTDFVPAKKSFGIADLWRMTLWGLAAAAAVSVIVYASSTDIGRDRAGIAVAELHDVVWPSGVRPARPLTAQEGRKLAETVRVLADDRERLVARIATLEHSMDDVTGSIAKVEKAAEQAHQAPPEPAAPETAVESAKEPAETTASVSAAATPKEAETEPVTDPAKTQFALDLGSAATIEQLRAAWTVAQRRHGALLQGLYPTVHQGPRAGRAAFHLLAGPLPSASAAARICMSMTAAGAICAPAVFDGQRLAVR